MPPAAAVFYLNAFLVFYANRLPLRFENANGCIGDVSFASAHRLQPVVPARAACRNAQPLMRGKRMATA